MKDKFKKILFYNPSKKKKIDLKVRMKNCKVKHLS